MAVGARVFLLRLGQDHGIVASGKTVSGSFQAEHWNETKGHGKPSNYVHVEWDWLLPVANRLKGEKLKSGPLRDWDWHPRASGTEFPSHLVPELERLWQEHVASVENGRDNSEREIVEVQRQVYFEGQRSQETITVVQRNPEARNACLAFHGRNCKVCGMNFKEKYGNIDDGYVHVHHLNPLGESTDERAIDPINDLVPVCPNCHAMLHRVSPPYSIEELQRKMEEASKDKNC